MAASKQEQATDICGDALALGLPSSAHAHSGMLALGVIMLALGILYLALALRRQPTRRSWSRWRTISFTLGCVMVAASLYPPLVPYPHGDFREHMLQHLALAMIAPILLVLAAPMTLLLRSLSVVHARALFRILKSAPVRFLTNPLIALTLNIGGMAALYFTPLYTIANHSPAWHLFLHVHFLAAGCLFAWVIAGPDPAPHRPSVPRRLVILGVSIAFHATLSQMLYAGFHTTVPAPAHELRGGAELMYYGGDIAELLLAFALVSTWKPRRRHERAKRSASQPRALA
ncbi:cytochrome c oxidase assembly protein [Pelagicoccus sp. SDUM812002]|uniref:cytochrome c oxidase assembly protein n=1 Tax=Pelagicoccus sp. SDUM812002 TaxID=3041266 RepID=UPI00280D0561|nr:cytochrome c oxidase assembly protein [Pelagicoccus sp. SDUM812002]MDQ8184136.1 cytochrome c oxidase assembly protein [Pelagicoccus sp. SDUM812002]